MKARESSIGNCKDREPRGWMPYSHDHLQEKWLMSGKSQPPTRLNLPDPARIVTKLAALPRDRQKEAFLRLQASLRNFEKWVDLWDPF